MGLKKIFTFFVSTLLSAWEANNLGNFKLVSLV